MGENWRAEYNKICRKEYGEGQKRSEKAGEGLHAGTPHKRQAGQGGWPGRPQPGDEARSDTEAANEMYRPRYFFKILKNMY